MLHFQTGDLNASTFDDNNEDADKNTNASPCQLKSTAEGQLVIFNELQQQHV